MKKLHLVTLVLAIALIFAGCTAGSAENTTLTSQYLPDGVEFIKSEKDDGFTEYEYRTTSGDEYTLFVDSSENVRALEFDAKVSSSAAEVALAPEDVFTLIKDQYPEAKLIAAVEDRDNGNWEWNLLFSSENILGFYEFDAASGTVLEYTLFYSINEPIDPAAIISANISDASITEISLDTDDGRLIISGEAASPTDKIEFSIDADTGTITEFEFDN